MKIAVANGLKKAVTKMPSGMSRRVFRTVLVTKKHSPVMLFGTGVIGVISTTVLACRATLKLDTALDEVEKRRQEADQALAIGSEKYTEKDHAREMKLVRIKTASTIVKLYAPPVALGVVSVALLTGSHVMLTKRNAGLLAALSGLDQAFKVYRQRVVDELGEEKDKLFRHGYELREVVDETENGPATSVVKRHAGDPTGYSRIFDKVNSKMWRPEHMVNQNTLRCQQEWANEMLRTQGYLMLNDVLKMLGMEGSSEGSVVGWIYENEDINPGDSYVDFGVFKKDVFMGQLFVNGDEREIWLDFNCAPVWDKINLVTKRKRNK